MNELIKVQYGQLGKEENVPTINARDLWERLEVKTRFDDWINRRLKEAQLTAGEDFSSLLKNEEREIGATIRKEYILSMDSAKHIAMLERSDKGKEVRQYFISFEKKAKRLLEEKFTPMAPLLPTPENEAASIVVSWMQIAQAFEIPKHLAQVEAAKTAKARTGVDCSTLLLVAPAQDNISERNIYLEVTEIGKRIGLSARKVNTFLKSQGLQKHDGKIWVRTEEGQSHSQIHQWSSSSKSGYNFKWEYGFIKKLWNEAQESE